MDAPGAAGRAPEVGVAGAPGAAGTAVDVGAVGAPGVAGTAADAAGVFEVAAGGREVTAASPTAPAIPSPNMAATAKHRRPKPSLLSGGSFPMCGDCGFGDFTAQKDKG